MKRVCRLLMVSTLWPGIAAGNEPTHELQRECLLLIASAETRDDLGAALAVVKDPDEVTLLVHAVKSSRLQGPAQDDALLDAIPRDEDTFWRVYSITYTDWGKNPFLNEVAGGGYVEDVAKAVVRSKRRLSDFFRGSSR